MDREELRLYFVRLSGRAGGADGDVPLWLDAAWRGKIQEHAGG